MASYSQSKSKSSSKPKNLQAGEYQNLIGPAYTASKNVLSAPGISGTPAFEGPLYAPMDAGETGALNRVAAYNPIDANSTMGSTYRGYADTIDGRYLDPAANPFLAASYEAAARPIEQAAYDQNMASRSLFTGSGQRLNSSSPFARVKQRTDRTTGEALSAAGEKVYGDNLQNERNAQLAATQAGGTYGMQDMQQQFKVLTDQLQAQELPRMIADFGVTRGLEVFKQRLDYLKSIMAGSFQASQPVAATTAKSSSSSMDAGIGFSGGGGGGKTV